MDLTRTRPKTDEQRGTHRECVTVVITCYNHGRWLPDAIGSVMMQDHQPIETIVVDDGSTDDTAEVCRRFPGIRYVHQENAGLSAARNRGLREASGSLITFLDADDLLMPHAIKTGARLLAENPDWAFVFGGHRGVDADRRSLWETIPGPTNTSYVELLRDNLVVMHATVLYRRQRLEAIGGFDASLRASEDYDVYLRLARSGAFGCHGELVAEYRRHGSNMSEDAARMLRSTMEVLGRQVPRNAVEAAALGEGIAHFQRRYGLPLVKQAIRDLATARSAERALKNLALATKLAPKALLPALSDTVASVTRRAERWLPHRLRSGVRRRLGRGPLTPGFGQINWGDFRRTRPIEPHFGFQRGKPIDRHYIEGFLARHAADIAGRVLEIGDNDYTLNFGGSRVKHSDVLHISEGAPKATIVGDLANAAHIPNETFDCLVLTQTLHLIFDMPAAIRTIHRILRPGGVVLITVPGITQIDRDEWRDTWYWSLTATALRCLLAEGWSEVDVETHGNVLSALAFLHGIATAELAPEELAVQDDAYPVIVAARAVKAGSERL
ncbi:glycosyltransferase [Falsiroseomonas sp.]|uniref:glycosyltransferase n=1 Tax=Falsiroseomonas sp. TaxID=2870721 RepID=UPI003566ABFE